MNQKTILRRTRARRAISKANDSPIVTAELNIGFNGWYWISLTGIFDKFKMRVYIDYRGHGQDHSIRKDLIMISLCLAMEFLDRESAQ